MAAETLGNVILRLLVDNKEFAEGLKNALQMVAISSKQIKDLTEFKIGAPDFSALDLALKENQAQLQRLFEMEKREAAGTAEVGRAKAAAIPPTRGFAGAMQDTFFIIQGGLSVYRLLNNTLGDFIRHANESQAAENKLAFGAREIEEAAPGATQRLKELAVTIRDKTGFEKDSIITAEANLAATFKNEEAVRKLIPLIVDITAFKKSQGEADADLTSITKALTQTVQGQEGALTRLGIKLDENIVKSGDVDAIVQELARTYGGYAEQQDVNIRAQGVFNDKLNETKESLGRLLNTALTPVLTPLANLLDIFTQAPPLIQSTTLAVAGLTIAAVALNTSLGGLPLLVGAIATGLVGLFGIFDQTTKSAEKTREEIEKERRELEEFREVVRSLSDAEIKIHVVSTEEEIATIERRLDQLRGDLVLGVFIGFDAFEKRHEFMQLEARLVKLKESLGILKETKFSVVPPQEPKTILELDAAIGKLQESAKKQTGEALSQTNARIAVLQKEKQALQQLGTDEGLKSQVAILERKRELQLITAEEYEKELSKLHEAAKEEETRLDLLLRIRNAKEEDVKNLLSELNTRREIKQLTAEEYIAALQTLRNRVAGTRQALELEKLIAKAIEDESALSIEAYRKRLEGLEEEKKRREELIRTGHDLRIQNISNEFERARAEEVQRYEQARKNIEEAGRLTTVTIDGTARYSKDAQDALAENERQHIIRNGQIDRDEVQARLNLEISLLGDSHAAAVAQINQQYDLEENEIKRTYQYKDQLDAALALSRKNRELALQKAALNSFMQGLNAAQSLIGGITALAVGGLGEAGDRFVRNLERALQIAQAIAAIMQAVNIFTTIFGFAKGGVPGKETGGYTGDVSPTKIAGVVHGGEVVFEEPIVRNNLKSLMGLRRLMQKGVTLDMIIPAFSSNPLRVLSTTMITPLGEVLQEYQGGGYVGGINTEIFSLAAQISGGFVALPRDVLEALFRSTRSEVSRDDFYKLVEQVGELRARVVATLQEEMRDLPERINLKIPEEITMRAEGGEIKRVLRTDGLADQ